MLRNGEAAVQAPAAKRGRARGADPSGLQLQVRGVKEPEDLIRASSRSPRMAPNALLVTPLIWASPATPRRSCGYDNRIPAYTNYKEWVEAGGLMAYGVNPAGT